MSQAAKAFDFRRLLDATFAQQVLADDCVPAEGIYEGRDGMQLRTGGPRSQLVQEAVQVTEGALLFASDSSAAGSWTHKQLVSDSDWVHFQFRLSGGGEEKVCNTSVNTPDKSCTVVRYPQDSIVERLTHSAESYRVACLLVSPKALTRLIGAPATDLPEGTLWIARDEPLELQATILPLSSAMRLAVNDILSCRYSGHARRTYMRGKSLELLSSVIHDLDSRSGEREQSGLVLSPLDFGKLDRARRIMLQEMECSMTLAELARRVGLNRTKLALGFKDVYGVSVQAFWRDEKLNRARELLQSADARITDVALSVGYSELSSFTRAFIRKFGEVPRAIKRHK